jgi:hypothetical protein
VVRFYTYTPGRKALREWIKAGINPTLIAAIMGQSELLGELLDVSIF